MSTLNMLFFAYLSPDTILPVTSIIAAIVGGSMFFTRRSIQFVGRCVRVALRRPRRKAAASKPHFQSSDGVAAR